jgi:hypothetical protein
MAWVADWHDLLKYLRIPPHHLTPESPYIFTVFAGGSRSASNGASAAKMAHSFDYDYFVIGGGSGGVRSSRIAAGYGAKVIRNASIVPEVVLHLK